MIGRIAVAAAVYTIDTPYSYRIPPQLEDGAVPGIRVLLPFGRGNRPTEGFLLYTEPEDGVDLKSVTQFLDTEPVLSDAMLHLAAFLRDRYFCTMYDACRALLPAGLWYAEKRLYCLTGLYDPVLNAPPAGSPEEALLCRLTAAGGSLEEQALGTDTQTQKTLGKLLTAGLVTAKAELRRMPEKSQELATLTASPEEALAQAARKKKSAAVQAAVLEFLARTGTAPVKEITYYTGAANAVIRRLGAQGWLTLTRQQVLRQPELTGGPPETMDLNPEQSAACQGLLEQMGREVPGVALLYGVTGSGKTAVYLHLIQKTVETGKCAILLVPEIALTPQLTKLFASHFPDQVAVLHSSLSLGQRYDQWQSIRAGKAKVIIGARSAVFAPVERLGIVIVDEEQEHSYKSETSPRYHAREVAIYRGQREGALVLLGSATPSIESMYRAKTGVYGLYTLRARYGGATLPQVTIADQKLDLLQGNSSPIGEVLRGELEENLARGQQSILFLNRRGNSRLLMCTACGYVPKCSRCSVSLTWHSANGRLMCHYCGHSETAPERCPACGGLLRPVGAGTQRVQEALERIFPGVRVLRMDTDTITAVNTHEAMLSRFEKERIPILVGTQMVAKGLNLKNVTLVGVLDGDMALYVDDFRAAENTFDLICQVVGRAGRGQAKGRAVIQTMTPDNRVLQLAAHQDYDGFYESELALRQGRTCPPECDLISVGFSALEEDQALQGSWRFRELLAANLGRLGGSYTILGPAPLAVARVNLYYRYRLTLAGSNSRPLRQLLRELMKEFTQDKRSKGITVTADVNAYE